MSPTHEEVPPIEVVIVEDPAAGARVVCEALVALTRRKPALVLGLATGSSPQPVYDRMAQLCATGALRLANAHAFLLDEYVGLPPGHPGSYRQTIEAQVVRRTDLDGSRVRGPDAWEEGTELLTACARYDALIAQTGGVDLQLLGVGTDGHIGFNEPGSSLGSRTRLKTLTAQTRRDNARFFDGDAGAVPAHVLTQGIGTILEARHLVLLAWGAGKAAAVARLVEGPLTASVPASALQLHPHATVVVDRPAAGGLERRSYYEEAWAAKPAWQGL